MELKSSPAYIKEIEDRSVTGFFSVFGNKDLHGDIAQPGSFNKTLKERKGTFKHLWMHDMFSPAIAVIDELVEVGKEALPRELLKKFPDASGAMQVKRTYLNTPRGNEVLEGIKAGVPYEMSYGYDPIKVKYEERDGQRVRILQEQKLWETSDVTWGANSATLASKAFAFAQQDPKFLEHLKALLEPENDSTHDTQELTEFQKSLQVFNDQAELMSSLAEIKRLSSQMGGGL